MNSQEFRKELVKLMPGYKWTVHQPSNPQMLSATGIKSSGFNRLATLRVSRTEKTFGAWYEVKSAGYGTKSPWAGTNSSRTLARALRGLQEHYEMKANTYRGLASQLQSGRTLPLHEGAAR